MPPPPAARRSTNAPAAPPSPEQTVSVSRPKFSRRPAQFSDTAIASVAPAPASDTVTPLARPKAAVTPSAPPSLWYEDLRFGMVLVALLLVVNVAFFYLLPQLSPAHPPITRESIAADPEALADSPAGAGALVTSFSKPYAEQSIPRQMDLRQSEEVQHVLSISAQGMPAPRARPLDRRQSLESNLRSDNERP